MLKKLLPLIALILGLAGGAASAVFLTPASPADHSSTSDEASHATPELEVSHDELEIVKLPNQFVVPVIQRNRVRAMVILTVALEVEAAIADEVREMEPKLRDIFLSELFALASLNGFDDEIVSKKTLVLVKDALTRKSKEVLHQDKVTVLITDMARQDVN